MRLREYQSEDCHRLAELFYQTVHTINAADYTQQQLDAWATGQADLAAWDRSFLSHLTLVATEGGALVGFGDIDKTGYLDRLYVHRSYQRKGIASALCGGLESGFSRVTTLSSITARPFFEQRGYVVVKQRQVERYGVPLKNYLMVKGE